MRIFKQIAENARSEKKNIDLRKTKWYNCANQFIV